MKKWIKRIYIGLLILVTFILVAMNIGMGAMKLTDAEIREYFAEIGFSGTIENVDIDGHKIKIISEAPEASDSILLMFVHGAPGSWDAFKDYLTDEDLHSKSRVVAYDRPGYGGSESDAMPSIQDQSHILKEIIKLYGLKKNVLVGHSYGGPIVGLAGLGNAKSADAVIMIAPLVDPVSEPLHWYSYFSYWKLTSWLLPDELVVAGSEKFAHSTELELIQDQWKYANCPIIHVHGLEDGLAPGKENIDFSIKHIPSQKLKTITYEDKGHLIIWTDYELMKDIIIQTLDNL